MTTTNSGIRAPVTAADARPPVNTDALRDAMHESAHPAEGASEEDVAKAELNLHAEIDKLADTFDGVVADLKDNQDKVLSHARELESTISDRTAELANEKDNIEVNVAERTTKLNAANDELRNQAAELSRRNHEITLLGSMNDSLQTCTTEAEAYSIIAETAAELFPEDSGAVFVLSSSRDMLEPSATWGPLGPAQSHFSPEDCQALRGGQVHLALGHEQRCPHVTHDERMYACVPLRVQNETLGIVHVLGGPIQEDKAGETRMREKCQLASVLADNIAVGVAFLKARQSTLNLAIRDPLTGLFNRRFMEEALTQEMHRSKRNGERLAVIMIDIDHFKQFNDSFGHDGGDAVLQALGTFLSNHVRDSDIACRYGGEEFMLILSPSTAEGAKQRAEKIRVDARQLKINHAERDLGAISLSLGVAIFPDHACDEKTIVKAADVALYAAKSGGRDRVVMAADTAVEVRQ